MAGISADRARQIRELAAGFLGLAESTKESIDRSIETWAKEAEMIRFTPKLDPYVGIKGVGLALYNYLRILAGADAIKPDGRVIQELNNLGFSIVKGDAASAMALGEALAQKLTIPRLVLDQHLWHRSGSAH